MAGAAAAAIACAVVVAYLGVAGDQPARSAASRQPDRSQTRAASRRQPHAKRSRQATTTASEFASPFLSAETSSWVQQENAKPGTTAWKLTRPATYHQIEGYASAVSVEDGDPVDLYVSTTSPTWGVQAFRMGYYGGDEGRLIWSDQGLPGVDQPPCPVEPPTHMVECSWQDPLTVSTAGWPQGTYLFKLTSAAGWQSYIPLTLRDDTSHSVYLVNDSVTTWEAYNTYGGYDLYQGPTGSLADRATWVSFDRPYTLGDGAGDFIGLELPMIAMMESHNLDVSYTTDVNVSEDPSLLLQHKTFISLGHDEYYSLSMYNGLEAARDAGVNLVFLGANAVYRHIRLQSSPLGPDRVEVDYKNAKADPLYGIDNADVTPWAWRDPPNNRPESALLGEMWQCNPVRANMVITDPSSWLFAGTGLAQGAQIPNIVGPEYDHFSAEQPNPGDVEVVASSPVDCNGLHSTADMTYYSNPGSEAGVWDTGTIDWVGQVLASCPTCAPPDAVTRITDNVLAAFGTGPAGRIHPSHANMGGSPASQSPPSTGSSPAGSLPSPTSTSAVPSGVASGVPSGVGSPVAAAEPKVSAPRAGS